MNYMIVTRVDKPNRFISKFDTATGFYLRSNTFDQKGLMTTAEPFMASFPELLDIGIMGRCKNAHRCKIGCYQGQHSKGENMKFEDYKSIINQCRGKTFQVALGGAGSPDEHENFREILKYTREQNIVPNYTTSGIDVSAYTAYLTKLYCGAVAVSWYREEYTNNAIRLFLEHGCTTNIHYVLSESSIDEALDILRGVISIPMGINALIFLLYKPIGKGIKKEILRGDKVSELVKLISQKHPFKIGFDSCSIPMLVSNSADVDDASIDSCEGGRYSAYISANMVMSPCSFDRSEKYGVSLRNSSIEQVWKSKEFKKFRGKLKSCEGCLTKVCLGPCPIVPEITECLGR